MVARFDLCRRHANALHLIEADLDGAGLVLLVGINGDVVHAHGVLLRHRRGVGKSHGIAVIENLPLCLDRRGLLRNRRRGDRLGAVRIPIAAGGTGDADTKDHQAVQTLHGASPNPC